MIMIYKSNKEVLSKKLHDLYIFNKTLRKFCSNYICEEMREPTFFQVTNLKILKILLFFLKITSRYLLIIYKVA